MSNAKSAKGNPASKRMSNPKGKARRAASHIRGEERKNKNRQANEALHREKMANGGLGRRERRRLALRRDGLL